MAGTKAGGQKAKETTERKHGADFWGKIGAKGGSVSGVAKGFASNLECNCKEFTVKHYKRNCAGKKGGSISKRGKEIKPKLQVDFVVPTKKDKQKISKFINKLTKSDRGERND